MFGVLNHDLCFAHGILNDEILQVSIAQSGGAHQHWYRKPPHAVNWSLVDGACVFPAIVDARAHPWPDARPTGRRRLCWIEHRDVIARHAYCAL